MMFAKSWRWWSLVIYGGILKQYVYTLVTFYFVSRKWIDWSRTYKDLGKFVFLIMGRFLWIFFLLTCCSKYRARNNKNIRNLIRSEFRDWKSILIDYIHLLELYIINYFDILLFAFFVNHRKWGGLIDCYKCYSNSIRSSARLLSQYTKNICFWSL